MLLTLTGTKKSHAVGHGVWVRPCMKRDAVVGAEKTACIAGGKLRLGSEILLRASREAAKK
jgi:hypothetical protein